MSNQPHCESGGDEAASFYTALESTGSAPVSSTIL